ncbi:MAG TPA: ROK family protein [Candidatus Limnocylindria bacterium]
MRQGQGEARIQGRSAARLRRRCLRARDARRRGEAAQGLSAKPYLGIDLGGTHIRSVVAMVEDTDSVPAIAARDERPTPRTGADDIIAEIAASANAALASAKISRRDVVAAGCSSPGPLDHATGIVHETPNLVGFRDVHLADRLSDALGTRVFVDRDTCMAAIAEGLVGAARGRTDFVYVTVSTGIGGSVVSGGRMLRGATNTAGEIGHWPVAFQLDPSRPADEAVPRCGCGSFGCVEAFASGSKMAEAFGSRDASDVFGALSKGDERARAIVVRAERALANLAVGLVNVMNPTVIVVGGSVAEYQPEHVLEPMRRAIAERAFRVASGAVRLLPAALGGDVGMHGAVLEARERSAGRGQWFL